MFMKYVRFANLAMFVVRVSPMLTLASLCVVLAMRMADESAQFPLDRGPLRCGSDPVLLRLLAIPTGCGLSPPWRTAGLTMCAGVNTECFILKSNRM